VFQITIFLLYAGAAGAFAWSRTAAGSDRLRTYLLVAAPLAAAALVVHLYALERAVMLSGTFTLTLTSAVSIIGLQLGMIASLAAVYRQLRGIASILLLIAATLGSLTYMYPDSMASGALTWQIQAHIALSMFAYGLLTAGAIVGVLALIQDRRLRARTVSPMNHLFAPLEMTERLLYGVATAGFVVLLLSVVTGIMFVENLFAQHLVHKTILSIGALLMFGTLVVGRFVSGWRGHSAVYLYLGAFALLIVAYFGSRYVLEVLLNRSWG